MSKINKVDTTGVKPLLEMRELGYDNYPAGGDAGRVYIGTGTENIPLAKKTEVTAVDTKADTHIGRVDNPHSVTKVQVGLGNVDNTADINKNVLSATKLATARKINGVSFNGTADINIETVTPLNDTLTSTSTTEALTANQGKVLKDLVDTKLNSTNPSITGSITEQVYNLTGTEINPANGTIQYKTVSANTTFTETLTAGQSVLLRLINASNYTITFPTITWVGAVAPILTANCAIVLWKEQSTLYGAYVGTLV